MKKNKIFFATFMFIVMLFNVSLLIDETDNSLGINLSQLEAQAQTTTVEVTDWLTGDVRTVRVREGYEMGRIDNPYAGDTAVTIGTDGVAVTYTEPEKIDCCKKNNDAGTYCEVDETSEHCS